MKKAVIVFISFILLAYLAFQAYQRYYPALTYIYPNLPAPQTQVTRSPLSAANTTGLPLSLPAGFSVSFYAQNLSGPRDLEFDPTGTLLVSEPSAGQVVSLPDKKVVASGLNRPHGLAFANGQLYVAQTNAVTIFDYDLQTRTAANGRKIIDLPSGGGHWTRSLLVNDSQLYVSIGSSCNICRESDPRRAAVYVANLDGTNFRTYATDLRNSVFMTTHPPTGDIWATDMGRDNLGDNLPPDEVNILREGEIYGWPACYGQSILDTSFAPSGRCNAATPSHIDIPAHSAPLGLAFIPDSWPADYRGDLLIAYHGSWNRSTPTGYKIVRFDLDKEGKRVGESDFITGFISQSATSGSDALGRPVDLLFAAAGHLYISDDKSGAVYLVTPPQNP